MRDVILVPQQQLQRVRSRLERDLGLGLAGAEVEVIEVVGNRLVERRQLGVDQQVVMSRIGAIRAGGRDAHFAQAESDGRLGRNGCAVLEVGEIDLGPRRRWRRPARWLFLGQGHAACRSADDQQCHRGFDELG